MNRKDLSMLLKVCEIAARNADRSDMGYIDRAQEVLKKEQLIMEAALASDPRPAEDLNGHFFLAFPEDKWMVSRFLDNS